MENKIDLMLLLQDSMNTKVNDNWREQGFEWYRAIWVECAEMLDHYGWKWWKKQEPDTEQVILELVDIWHFGLSQLLIDSKDSEVAAQIAADLSKAEQGVDFKLALEAFAADTLNTKAFNVQKFATLMASIDLDFDGLYKRYIGKNVLNFFRQDNGYKDGSYIKVWNGQEDNEHLVEVVNSLDVSSPDFKDKVYEGLKARYPAVA